MLDHIRIVLVRPIRPGNVGAASRAMKNMGLSDLVLVSPAADPSAPEAEGFAARAKPILRGARVVETIPEALAGCTLTLAASGKRGMYRRQAAVTAEDAARLAVRAAGSGGRVAIAFGPEDQGLVLRELLYFDRVVEIPANPQYPVLNLAAAVLVVCYELRRAWLAATGRPPWPPPDEPLATADRRQVFYDKLFESLEMIGFFGGQQNPEHLKYALRRVFGRIDMSVNEVDILIGMTQQIRWYAERHPRS